MNLKKQCLKLMIMNIKILSKKSNKKINVLFFIIKIYKKINFHNFLFFSNSKFIIFYKILLNRN